MNEPATASRSPSSLGAMLVGLLYPRLRRVPPERWRRILERARSEPLDAVETISIAAAVGLAAWLLETMSDAPRAHGAATEFLLQFLAATPLVAAIAGPLLLRRTRRGIERELRRPQP